MPSNSVLIAALVVLAASFLGLYAVLGSALGAALVAAGAAVIVSSAGQSISAARARRALQRRVQKSNARVAYLAGQVTDVHTRASLLRACDTVPVLLSRTETVDPASLSTTYRALDDYLGSVEAVLERYLEIQNRPGRYHDAAALLAHSRQVLTGFEAFAEHSAEQVRGANMESFFTALAHLELLSPPPLPRIEDR
ncbi:hypothetical protein [Nocardia crassostreae]|uniref:hypothetical protein n=1 Tax=Nocardia crassostreae TaxID=53428 RepID=UPI000834B86C|nr:hypothetical protein [Nocardia crassostreae]